MLKEFFPAFRFLLVFVGIYLLSNLVYGIWITSLDTTDPFTIWVTRQCAEILSLLSHHVEVWVQQERNTVSIMQNGKVIINIFEGCNGINVAIVFVSFVFSFGGSFKKMLWFIPAGLFIIHLSNLLRLCGLYWIALESKIFFYYVHKYFFTAFIYLVVFVLWWFWVDKVNKFSVRRAFLENNP